MKDETLRRYEEGRRGVDTAKLRRIAEAMGKRLEDVLLPTDVARGADSPTPAPERSAAIRQKKLEIAVLYIDEIAAGQPAEVRAKLLNEALAYLDGLGQKVSANGIG